MDNNQPSPALAFLREYAEKSPRCCTRTLNGQTLTICMTPLTVGEMKKIEAMSKGNPFESTVYTIIEKATDEAGTRHFSIRDKPEMMRLPAQVWSDIITELFPKDEEGQDPN